MLIWVDLESYWRLWRHTYIHPYLFPIYRDPIGSNNGRVLNSIPASLPVCLSDKEGRVVTIITIGYIPLGTGKQTEFSVLLILGAEDGFLKFFVYEGS